MTKAALDDDDEKPLDPAVEKVRRKLVRFVGINLGLLFVALMAVVAAIVYKSRSEVAEVPGQEAEIPVAAGDLLASGKIALPAGAKIVSQALSGNRVSLDVELAGGARALFVYDLATGRMMGRFDIAFK